MNVLSLFDGMSCGQLALKRAGIHVDNYYASEIDKYAIKVTKANFPNTICLGDVLSVSRFSLEFIYGALEIGLLIAGSPCQGLSFCGKLLDFDDPRSKLFFEFVRIYKEFKPKYFLLENVRMRQNSQDVISELLGVQPIVINSNLVSAQNRHRLYWTNIPGIALPEDKGIFLKDILEDDCNKLYQVPRGNNKGGLRELKAPCMGASSWEHNVKVVSGPGIGILKLGNVHPSGKGQNGDVFSSQGKSPSLTTNKGEGMKIVNIREKSKCVRSSGRGSYDRHEWDSISDCHYRKLTPVECERLQTVPDNYTNHVSNSQRYKMLGNGWTVDVIAHILKGVA